MQALARIKRSKIRSSSFLSLETLDERLARVFKAIDGTIESSRKERAKDIAKYGESHWTVSRWDSFIHGLTTSKEFIKTEFEN